MPGDQTIITRILEYLAYRGIRKSAFERRCGLSNGYLNSVKGNVGAGKLDGILKAYPEIDRHWLLTGEGEMIRSDSRVEASVITNPHILMAPLVTKYAYAGYLNGYGDMEYVDTLPRIPFVLPEQTTARGEYIAFEVRGDSMDNDSPESLLEGDTLLCRRIKRELWTTSRLHLKKWNFVIVTKDGVICKRIVDHDLITGTITIHSLNDYYPDEVIPLEDVYEIFNVVQFMRKPRI